MSLVDTMRANLLKAEARRLVLSVRRKSATMDCGAHLADFISPELARASRRFTEIGRELAKLDPEAKRIVDKGEWVL